MWGNPGLSGLYLLLQLQLGKGSSSAQRFSRLAHREAKLSLEIHDVQVSPTQECGCVPIVHSLYVKSSRMDLSVEEFIKPIALHKQHCGHPLG